MNKQDVLALLAAHVPFDDAEKVDLARIGSFVTDNEDFWQRSNRSGHVTASAWVLGNDYRHTLLTHHRKLERWLQLGGHIEDDADLLAAALREAREESGLTEIRPLSSRIFDIDVHLIPARGDEPAHYHYDVRFALLADHRAPLVVSSESKALRWMPIEQLPRLVDEASLLRMMDKTRHLVR